MKINSFFPSFLLNLYLDGELTVNQMLTWKVA